MSKQISEQKKPEKKTDLRILYTKNVIRKAFLKLKATKDRKSVV